MPNRKGHTTYGTTIAAKLLKQLESIWGRLSPHFHRPVALFIGDIIYVIMVDKDVKLSSVVRALREKTTPKKVEDAIRHVKQSYGLKYIRLFKYDKIKALAYPPSEASAVGGSMRGAIVLATTYFSIVWIGNSEKHDVIARSIARMAFRIHDVPEFHSMRGAQATS